MKATTNDIAMPGGTFCGAAENGSVCRGPKTAQTPPLDTATDNGHVTDWTGEAIFRCAI